MRSSPPRPPGWREPSALHPPTSLCTPAPLPQLIPQHPRDRRFYMKSGGPAAEADTLIDPELLALMGLRPLRWAAGAPEHYTLARLQDAIGLPPPPPPPPPSPAAPSLMHSRDSRCGAERVPLPLRRSICIVLSHGRPVPAVPADVGMLLDAGHVVDWADDTGRTALHVAAGDAVPEAVDRLVAAGASATAVGPVGMTPLHRAAVSGAGGAAISVVSVARRVDGLPSQPSAFVRRENRFAPEPRDSGCRGGP